MTFDLVFTRDFALPRDRIFRAWTTPDLLAQWFAPPGMTIRDVAMDVRPGGILSCVMGAPDGSTFPTTFHYLEVLEPERIVFTDKVTADGTPAPDAFIVSTCQFDEIDGGTRYTGTARHFTEAARDEHLKRGFHEGAAGVADQLERVLKQIA